MIRWFAPLLIVGLVSPAWSDDAKPTALDSAAMMKAMAEFSQPGPEHQKLQPLAGKWNFNCKMWMDPSQPPMESKGTIERKWILGNRFLEEHVMGTGFDGKTDFEGRGVLGFDNGTKQFTHGWVCTMSTNIGCGQGTFDAGEKKFTFEQETYCPIRKRNIKTRDVVRIESDDKNVMEMYDLEGGKETKMMELVSIRQK